MNDILLTVQAFLDKANREAVEISEELLDEFAANCRAALAKQFTEGPQKFTLRMSNMGKPLCQLQKEAAGDKGDPLPYSHKMKMLIGDMTEAAAIVIMKAAGVHVQKTQEPVQITFNLSRSGHGNVNISGTYDVLIDGAVYDIKSASPYAFQHKFNAPGAYTRIKEDDTFGYMAQGYGYGAAAGTRFGGWIVIEKSTGEWAVVDTPYDEDYAKDRHDALQKAMANVSAIVCKEEFKRCFDDVEEVFYKKPTGNRVLGFECSYCAFRRTCWPEAQALPQIVSKGQNPKTMFYTVIDPKYANQHTSEESEGTQATAVASPEASG